MLGTQSGVAAAKAALLRMLRRSPCKVPAEAASPLQRVVLGFSVWCSELHCRNYAALCLPILRDLPVAQTNLFSMQYARAAQLKHGEVERRMNELESAVKQLQVERDALAIKADTLERCLLQGDPAMDGVRLPLSARAVPRQCPACLWPA